MIGLVLKDILVMRKTIRTYAMFLLFYLVMTVLNLFTISFTTAILQLIVMLLPMSAFSFDEAAKWDRYALTFPLGRRALVSGRYLFALVMTVFAALCGLLSCVLVSIFDNQDMILENMMTVMVCLRLSKAMTLSNSMRSASLKHSPSPAPILRVGSAYLM